MLKTHTPPPPRNKLLAGVGALVATVVMALGLVLPAQANNVQDITVHDSPDGDVIAVTGLKALHISDGTAPFDTDDTAGNDSSDHNGIVRSFDTVTYNFQYSLTPDNPYDYYRQVKVGFRFMLPYPESQVTFDTSSMNWLKQTKVTHETLDGVDTQVLTGFRQLAPTASMNTVAPGTFSGNLIVSIQGAPHGFTFQPNMSVWAEPSQGVHQAATLTFPQETVSAELNLNVRIHNRGVEGTGYYDFAAGDEHAVHREVGQIYGKLYNVILVTEMRWSDRTKGLKGLEIPQGDISVDVHISTQYQDDTTAHTVHPRETRLQPYLYDDNAMYGRGVKNVNDPNVPFNYNHADERNTTGSTNITHVSRDKDGWHGTLTIHGYDPLHWPYVSSITQGFKQCESWAKDPSCSQWQVAALHSDVLMFVIPTVVDGKNIPDLYQHIDQVATVSITDTNLQATSVTGQHTRGTQSVTSDDSKLATFALHTNGWYENHMLYTGYQKGGYTDSGTTFHWRDPQSNRGSDIMTPQRPFGIQLGFRASFPAPNDAPVLAQQLVKIDGNHLQFNVPANQPYTPPENSWGTWNHRLESRDKVLSVQFAVKPDGEPWKDNNEARMASFDDLTYYPTVDEAQHHGVIVGALVTAAPVVDIYHVDYGVRYGWGHTLPVIIPNTTPLDSTLPITEESRIWSRGALASTAHLPVNDNLDHWYNWVTSTDWKHVVATVAPSASYSGNSYVSARFSPYGEYLGGDTTGQNKGDTLFVSGEIPHVALTVAQHSGNTPKTVFDLDLGERTIDWKITATATAPGQPDTNTTDYMITDTLPKGLTYIPGSASMGGDYQQHTPQAGSVTGGTPIEPESITTNDDGTTTIQWVLHGAKTNASTYLYYSTSIGTPDNPDTDATNNQQFPHTVSIQSTHYRTTPSPTLSQVATATATVSKLTQTSLATRAVHLINDINQPLTYSSVITNAANSNKHQALAVDILPYLTNSAYHGDWSLSRVQLSAQSGATLQGVKVYVTDDNRVRDMKPEQVTAQLASSWRELAVHDGEVQLPQAFHPVAWALVVPTLPAHGRIQALTEITPQNNHGGDRYIHYWSDGDNRVQAMIQTVNRQVNGTVWQDTNHDGIRQSDEPVLCDIQVQLVDRDHKPVRAVGGNALQTVTDQHGHYTLDNIPAGSGFRLVFTPRTSGLWQYFQLTERKVQAAGVQYDSDAYTDDHTTLTQAYIPLNEFPQTNAMSSTRYVDSFEDVGLIAYHKHLPSSGSMLMWVVLALASTCIIVGVVCVVHKRHMK